MTEHSLVDDCQFQLTNQLLGVHLWKIADGFTGGKPDLEVNWAGHTTKIEFKFLRKNETVHDKWADDRQLIECVKYENTTGRCWVVAYRAALKKANRKESTIIYRPSALLHGKLPVAEVWSMSLDVFASRLWEQGVILFEGFNHMAVERLIRQTHI